MYTFPHRWDAVQPGWFVRAPDGTTWRYEGFGYPPQGQSGLGVELSNEAGQYVTISGEGMVDVLFMPVTTEDLALAALRRNFPNIEKISTIMDELGDEPSFNT
jgi:hypothetical protein